MRIVHLSDIHLSKNNYDEFIRFYKDALINDLNKYNSLKPIDIIVITGDLVDRGGHSLKEIEGYESYINPYQIFEKIFIDPISQATGIKKQKFLFIPGNHDVDERSFLWYDECEMNRNCKSKIEDYLKENLVEFKNNIRIKDFKEFEKEFHKETPMYLATNNESTYIYDYEEKYKVGFLLINDSWRCKSAKLENEDKLYFGAKQLHNCLDKLSNTDLNICLFHHNLDDFVDADKTEVKRVLSSKNIELFLHGHSHTVSTEIFYSANTQYIGFRGRAALNKPDDPSVEYQVGYQIFDFNLETYKIQEVHYRQYLFNKPQFIPDSRTAPPDGIDKYTDGKGFLLSRIDRIEKISGDEDKMKFKFGTL